MPTIKFKTYSLYYEEYGNGQPLILIAGLASDSQSWLPVIDRLAEHFRVFVFDNIGVGRSSQNNANTTIKKMAENCAELIKHLNLTSVHLLGHSMGGMIAMELAVKYPNMVDKMALVATSPKLNERNTELFNDWVSYLKSGMEKGLWFKNLFYWIFSPGFFEDKVSLERAVKIAIDYPYPQSDNSFENQVNAMNEFDGTEELNSIEAATLIIYGENDILFPPEENQGLLKGITNAKSVTIPNAAHSIHMENPGGFVDTVIGFL